VFYASRSGLLKRRMRSSRSSGRAKPWSTSRTPSSGFYKAPCAVGRPSRGWDGHDVPVTEEEWEAYRTLQRHYEKLSEGSTDD
jgi:hypothetical protein